MCCIMKVLKNFTTKWVILLSIIPASCPKCGTIDLMIESIPPDEHEYNGWIKQIECNNCHFEAYEAEISG